MVKLSNEILLCVEAEIMNVLMLEFLRSLMYNITSCKLCGNLQGYTVKLSNEILLCVEAEIMSVLYARNS